MRCSAFALLIFTIWSCGDNPTSLPVESKPVGYDRPFDEGFLYGTATAGFQVDMGCPTLAPEQCDDKQSDWYVFTTDSDSVLEQSNHLVGEDPAKVSPGHWELYETDYDLAKNDLHGNSFRMSIEWSRIFPTSTIGVSGYDNLKNIANSDSIATYHAMFAAMRTRGLTPLVTIHHYTLPLWIHDPLGCHDDFDSCSPKGWLEDSVMTEEIAKYAGFIAKEFGGEVDLWATQNEPFAVLLPAFISGTEERSNPPALPFNFDAGKTAFRVMIEAHARMYDAVKENDTTDSTGDGNTSLVGLISAVVPFEPQNEDFDVDKKAAENGFYLWNTAFLDGVAKGILDDDLDGKGELRSDLAGRLDYIGVNYKTIARVKGGDESFFPDLSPLMTVSPLSVPIDEVHPPSFFRTLEFLHERYDLPMYITEHNGQHVPKDNMELEIKYVTESIQWMQVAIDKGMDVRGYYYWSLMDNYEWNRGMTGKKLGLYEVGPNDPQRIRKARKIAETIGKIGKARGVPKDLLDEYPVYESELRAKIVSPF